MLLHLILTFPHFADPNIAAPLLNLGNPNIAIYPNMAAPNLIKPTLLITRSWLIQTWLNTLLLIRS